MLTRAHTHVGHPEGKMELPVGEGAGGTLVPQGGSGLRTSAECGPQVVVRARRPGNAFSHLDHMAGPWICSRMLCLAGRDREGAPGSFLEEWPLGRLKRVTTQQRHSQRPRRRVTWKSRSSHPPTHATKQTDPNLVSATARICRQRRNCKVYQRRVPAVKMCVRHHEL